jgi:hypothetical protein
MRTLDSFEFDILDFLKLDCEGYEYFVMVGGAEIRFELDGDYIMSW